MNLRVMLALISLAVAFAMSCGPAGGGDEPPDDASGPPSSETGEDEPGSEATNCEELFGPCQVNADCCGQTRCLGAAGPDEPGYCDDADDEGESCQEPAACVSHSDCCAPQTCVGAELGMLGTCG